MKSRQHIGIRKNARTLPPQVAVKRSWKRPLLLALTVLLAFGATWAFCELVLWSKVPSELVGKWVVTEGPQVGATFDFYRSGTMVGRVNDAGNEAIVNASIRVEDKKIYSTTRNPQTGRDDTMVLTIRTLGPNALVVDGQGQILIMERAELSFLEKMVHFLSL
jgi:hypothetical protein